MDQALVREIFDKLNAISLAVATLTAKAEEKETRCEDHKTAMADHETRIRVIESVQSSSSGSNTTSHNWTATLINAGTMAGTVAAVIVAMRAMG